MCRTSTVFRTRFSMLVQNFFAFTIKNLSRCCTCIYMYFTSYGKDYGSGCNSQDYVVSLILFLRQMFAHIIVTVNSVVKGANLPSILRLTTMVDRTTHMTMSERICQHGKDQLIINMKSWSWRGHVLHLFKNENQ